MLVDHNIAKNQKGSKAKKIALYFFCTLIFTAFSFGSGILAAELKIRKAGLKNPGSTTVVLEQVIPEEKPEEKTDPVVSLEEPQNSEQVQPIENQEAQETKITFAVIGDTQRFEAGNNTGGFQKAVAQIKKLDVSLVFENGDLLSSCDGKSGCEGKLNIWKNILGPLFSKTYVTMGNHDRTEGEKSDSLWQKFFNLPANGPAGYSELTYSFNNGNSHFIVLNSEKPEEHVVNKTQRDWLEKDLSANKLGNIFVFYHEPAYPVSSKIDESLDVKSGDRNALWNIFTQYKVTAVFSGHEHIASRRKIGGIYQFVFGNTDSFDHDLPKSGVAEYAYKGRAFGIVEIVGENITVKTYSVDGKILDTFALKK